MAREAQALGPEEEYRAVFEAAPDGIIVVDADGRIVDLNPAAEGMFGYDREELLGSEVETLVPAASRSVHREERREYVADPHRRPMGIGMELRGVRKDGSEFPVEISLSPLESEGEVRVISIVRDVTDRKRLRRFGAGTMRAAEEERRRIARELHDDTAQRLAGLLVRLRLARQAEGDAEREEILEEIREEIVGAAEAIRRVARGLRPPALEDAGLGTAIRSHVRQRLEASSLEVHVEMDPVDDRLDDEAKLAVYRIVQEALSNALRHADAASVWIRVRGGDGHVVAEVEDDGRGFEPSGSVESNEAGLGILGMRERASIAGGELEIESASGRGTTVRVRVPTSDREREDG